MMDQMRKLYQQIIPETNGCNEGLALWKVFEHACEEDKEVIIYTLTKKTIII